MAGRRRYLWGAAVACLPLVVIGMGMVVSGPCGTLEPKSKVATAVVLGSTMLPDGQLHISTQSRVEAGAALYHRGAVQFLHMTGGPRSEGGPTSGDEMARAAVRLGVPAERITAEGRSYSTLQNALFSKEQLKSADALILVSHGFHLARAWLSFAWAGLQPEAVCYHALFRTDPKKERAAVISLSREYLAVWFNLGRATFFSSAKAIGLDPNPIWLR